MLVMGQRVSDDIAGRIARTDGRHLEIEIDPFLRYEPALAELPPGSFEVCLVGYNELPFTVVAKAPCLQYQRQTNCLCSVSRSSIESTA